jgi:hypothetical protein
VGAEIVVVQEMAMEWTRSLRADWVPDLRLTDEYSFSGEGDVIGAWRDALRRALAALDAPFPPDAVEILAGEASEIWKDETFQALADPELWQHAVVAVQHRPDGVEHIAVAPKWEEHLAHTLLARRHRVDMERRLMSFWTQRLGRPVRVSVDLTAPDQDATLQ